MPRALAETVALLLLAATLAFAVPRPRGGCRPRRSGRCRRDRGGMIGERRSRDGWEVLFVLARLARIDTTSLVDAAGGLRVLPASLRPVRRGLRLVGRALTVDAREDLLSVVEGLRLSGPGDVLVVAGSDRHAVAGELFATEALRRGVAGMVIDGLCRDTRTLAELDLPVYARGTAPSACPARAAPGRAGADHDRDRPGAAGRPCRGG